MSTILCPTRGGEASIPNQERAIDLAKERGVALVFLYVSNIHFLDHMASPVAVDVVAEQLDEGGEFLLAMAKERADQAGVEAHAAIRRGQFRQALEEVIEEYHIATVVLGSASQGTGITTPQYRRELIQFLVSECGVEVVLSAVGKVIEHYEPDNS